MNNIFRIEELRPIRDGFTISRDTKLGDITKVTLFSLGKDTSISQESYDRTTMYIGAFGKGDMIIGDNAEKLTLLPGHALIVPSETLCGVESDSGMVYTEIILENNAEKEIIMNQNVKANEVFELKNLISYEEGSIANMDVVSNPSMKYVLMAFDEGTGLTPHRAPGNAIVFALEGKATIGYEGKDYELSEGECFKFEKNGLHSVTANGKFKMALLLVLE
ncbi:MAG TPA: cupin domain-containing protein [Lachnospiraceae bacterium]|nr:cupin domain-containing protein [uncultured Lachnoclostridium sp.]HAU87510.1 cupin domain-containing protein [Lachnospiraceae bacterium]